MCRFLQREWPQQDEPDLSSYLLRLRLVNRDDPDFRSLVDSFFTRLPQQDEPRS